MDSLYPQLTQGSLELRLGLFFSQRFIGIRLSRGLISAMFIQIDTLGKPIAHDIPRK
jgi:hypothetical protein